MSSDQEAVLSFEIIIDAKLSEETKQTLEKLKDAEPTESSAAADAEELLEFEDELTNAQLDQIRSVVGETLGGLDKADMVQFGAFAKNPTSAVGKVLTRLLGSGGAAILGPLAIAITAPIVMAEFIKAMSVKGGPFNRDWRRFIQNEIRVGLSREQQLEDRFGVSQTILTQIRGFAPNNENWTYNSLYDVNDQRIARIGLSDREAGVTVFLQ